MEVGGWFRNWWNFFKADRFFIIVTLAYIKCYMFWCYKIQLRRCSECRAGGKELCMDCKGVQSRAYRLLKDTRELWKDVVEYVGLDTKWKGFLDFNIEYLFPKWQQNDDQQGAKTFQHPRTNSWLPIPYRNNVLCHLIWFIYNIWQNTLGLCITLKLLCHGKPYSRSKIWYIAVGAWSFWGHYLQIGS